MSKKPIGYYVPSEKVREVLGRLLEEMGEGQSVPREGLDDALSEILQAEKHSRAEEG